MAWHVRSNMYHKNICNTTPWKQNLLEMILGLRPSSSPDKGGRLVNPFHSKESCQNGTIY